MGIYEELGIRRIINGAGGKTRLSGTIMPSEVVEAMVDASRSLVDMEHLQARASETIAEITGAEAGLVTTGAAAALTLGTAACVTGLDIAKMEKLPDTSGMKNEVIIARHHRNAYDHAIRLAGVKLVEAGLNEVGAGVGVRPVEAWEIESAITEKTAAIAYLVKPASTPPLEEVARIGKRYGTPLIVDAAAELPPVSNLSRFVSQGADLVAFSGGKAIRGPQSTGILCGKKDLIMSAALQMLDMDSRFDTWNPPPNFIDRSRLKGVPRHGIGRGFKAGKEEIVGLITALRLFANKDNEKEIKDYEGKARYLAESLGKVDGISALFLPPGGTRVIPLTEIRFLKLRGVSDMVRIVEILRRKDSPIYLDERRLDEMVLQVNPTNLQDSDLDIIAQAVRGALLEL